MIGRGATTAVLAATCEEGGEHRRGADGEQRRAGRRAFLNGADAARDEQRQWLRNREACVDADCTERLYDERIAALQSGGQAADR